MFGISHLQFYDLQSPTAERNIFKLGSNSILAKLIRSSDLVITENERSVNAIAMNLTENETTNNNNNNNNNNTNNNGGANSGSSGKSSPVATKNINRSTSTGSTGSPTSIMRNTGKTNNKGRSDSLKYSYPENYEKSSELDSSVDSAKINNDLAGVNANTTTIDTNSLKRLSGITKQSVDMQKRKYLKVISFLNQHNQHLELELTKEKRRRADELSKVIKSLLCFEAKLKHDKKVINQKLYERDTEIARLRALNRVLRKKYAVAAALVENRAEIDESLIYDDLTETDFEGAQNCPNCRREFYELTGKEVWTQTFVNGRSSLDDNTENGSSSDETVSSSFYGARRSVRYTSKRNFHDYMRSRSMTIDDSLLDNSEDNLSRDGAEHHSNYGKTNAFSRKMERLHGVRRIESFTDEAELDSENELSRTKERRRGIASKTPSTPSSINGGCCGGEYESDDIFTPVKSRSSYRVKKFAETSPKQEFEASTDDWYASASDLDDSENLRVKPYGYNAVNPVLECVNQILLQQSMDECIMDGPPSLESSENASGSSGGSSSQQEGRSGSRKRVHFSIKNSMVHVPRDGRMISSINSSLKSVIDSNDQKDCNLNYESIYSNEYERIGSEHNSSNLYVDMESKFGQEDRLMTNTQLSDKPQKKPPALPPKPANLIKFKRVLKNTSHSPVDSIKEDDPRLDEEASREPSEEPDYCSISEVNEAITSVQIVVDVHKSADDDISSQNSEAALSQKTDDAVEIFADVPKLPNVAAIIVPKSSIKNNKSIVDSFMCKDPAAGLDNGKACHIPNILAEINKKINSTANHTLSPPTTPSKTVSFSSIISTSPSKIIPIIKMPQPSPTTPTASHNMLPVPEPDKLPLQAEFDWYNLDAEYGKSNQPDVIKETDANGNSPLEYHHSHHQMMMGTVNEVLEENDSDSVQDAINEINATEDSVEYKLDEEFSLTNQPDIIKENVFETTPSRTRSSKSKSVCNGFPTIADESPGSNGGQQTLQQQQNHRVKINRKNFKNFMDTSGLSAKPMPRQRKIYFSGPFV